MVNLNKAKVRTYMDRLNNGGFQDLYSRKSVENFWKDWSSSIQKYKSAQFSQNMDC